ncbi:MAG: polymerase sigma-70 factor, subfamily [Myxococcaceae bacterium]|nr:polymerase sigma-70 factor, subfamily [Myxococcaceae bacterium]
MTDSTENTGKDELEKRLAELRPKLHRYCARMTGSVIDGEDVVQEALLKAIEALPRTGPLDNPEGWVFRIAHNAAQDFLRRRARGRARQSDEEVETMAAQRNDVLDRQAAAASVRTFMRLPASQRSSVILRDVLGYSIEEIREILGGTIPAIKGTLQRGRVHLRALAEAPDESPMPALTEADRVRLESYIDRFNLRDFDAIRDMLADDVRLELVNRVRLSGRQAVGAYYHRYAEGCVSWRCVPGSVDGRPAILMVDPNDTDGRPAFFILLDWADEKVTGVRDFMFARYAMEGAEVLFAEG